MWYFELLFTPKWRTKKNNQYIAAIVPQIHSFPSLCFILIQFTYILLHVTEMFLVLANVNNPGKYK